MNITTNIAKNLGFITYEKEPIELIIIPNKLNSKYMIIIQNHDRPYNYKIISTFDLKYILYSYYLYINTYINTDISSLDLLKNLLNIKYKRYYLFSNFGMDVCSRTEICTSSKSNKLCYVKGYVKSFYFFNSKNSPTLKFLILNRIVHKFPEFIIQKLNKFIASY